MSKEKLVLKGENLVKTYGSKKVVKGVSVQVQQGEIIGLLGPNGAGKTTTFYMIVGLVKPTEGSVFLDKENITSNAMYKRAQKGIGYLAQEPSVFRKLSVEDNILGVLQMTKLSKKEQRKRTDALIEEFGLEHVRHNRGDLLSGGERRRTEIARALAVDPKFILLDEPFAGVDPIAVEDIQKIVQSLVERNIGILITDHNVQQTLAITDKTYIMFEGRILKEGTPAELADDPAVRKVYLGENFNYQPIDRGIVNRISHYWVGNFDSQTELNRFVRNQLENLPQLKGFVAVTRHYPTQRELNTFFYEDFNLESDSALQNDDDSLANSGSFNSSIVFTRNYISEEKFKETIEQLRNSEYIEKLKDFNQVKYLGNMVNDN